MARKRTWYLWVPTVAALAAAVLQIGLVRDGRPEDRARDRDLETLPQDTRATPLGSAVVSAPDARIAGATGQVALAPGAQSRGPVRYRWIAPDGVERIRFALDEPSLTVAAYALDSRLVSGIPASAVALPVRAGEQYWIEVRSTATPVASAVLRWRPEERANTVRNDDVANADPIVGVETDSHFGFIEPNAATVEPREPSASGVRTAWWAWTAPSSIRYAWQVTAMIPHPLALAVFSDGAEMTLIDRGAGNGEQQLVFDAVAGTRYLIAAGVRATAAVTAIPAGPVVFVWGPTPTNDDQGLAATLMGASGSTPGSTEFATIQPGEQAEPHGDASVWWRWRAPRTDWYRFALDDVSAGAIAVYPTRNGHADGPPVAVSRATPTPFAAFKATAGESYAIRVAHDALSVKRRFTLSWSHDTQPAWLRFGSATDGLHTSPSDIVIPGNPARIAFNGDGDELYVATESGLAVYDRGASGQLTYRQTLAGVDHNTRLFWDAETSSLIAVSCDALLRFPASRSGPGLTTPRMIAGSIPCTSRQLAAATLLRDRTGTYVHFAGPLGIATLRFNRDRSVMAFMRGTPVEGLVAATLGAHDAFLYAATADGLRVFARDRNTGVLTARGPLQATDANDAAPIRVLKSDAKGRFLFALTDDRRVRAFDLTEPDSPVMVAETSPIGGGTRHRQYPTCSFIDIRADGLTADVVCADMAASARLLLDPPAMRWEEVLQQGGVDAFGTSLPRFRLDQGVAVSPDNRHIYATQPGQLLVFERTGQS